MIGVALLNTVVLLTLVGIFPLTTGTLDGFLVVEVVARHETWEVQHIIVVDIATRHNTT